MDFGILVNIIQLTGSTTRPSLQVSFSEFIQPGAISSGSSDLQSSSLGEVLDFPTLDMGLHERY